MTNGDAARVVNARVKRAVAASLDVLNAEDDMATRKELEKAATESLTEFERQSYLEILSEAVYSQQAEASSASS